MQVTPPPIFYKSTNIVLHKNHQGICSGQIVPTPKIYGIGSAPIMRMWQSKLSQGDSLRIFTLRPIGVQHRKFKCGMIISNKL